MNISSQIAAVVSEVENSQLGLRKVKYIGKHCILVRTAIYEIPKEKKNLPGMEKDS